MMCKGIFLLAFAVLIILLEFFSYQAIARKIWIQAEDYEEIEGNMANGSDVGVEDEEALGDFVLPTASSAAGDNPEWYVQYTVRIPEDGTWFLWGRYKHPNAGGYSFCLDLLQSSSHHHLTNLVDVAVIHLPHDFSFIDNVDTIAQRDQFVQFF